MNGAFSEISNVLGQYVRFIDDRRFADMDLCFTADAVAIYSGVPVLNSCDEIIGHVSRLARFAVTQHLLFPLTIRPDADTATAFTYGTAILVIEAEGSAHAITRGLSYDLKLVRGDAGWRIYRLEQRALWAIRGEVTIAPGSAFTEDSASFRSGADEVGS